MIRKNILITFLKEPGLFFFFFGIQLNGFVYVSQIIQLNTSNLFT